MATSGSTCRVRETPAFKQLTRWAKHEYLYLYKNRKATRRDFKFDAWLKSFLDRKADITLTFHEPRDFDIKDELVSAAEEELKAWKRKGTLKV